jgi:hypothetical protein
MMDFLDRFGATAHKATSDGLRAQNAWRVFDVAGDGPQGGRQRWPATKKAPIGAFFARFSLAADRHDGTTGGRFGRSARPADQWW